MLEMLGDERTTGLVVVATPEEMPVTESIELVDSIRSTTKVDVAGVCVNRALPELFTVRDEAVFSRLAEARPGVLAESRFDGVFAAALHATSRRRVAAENVARLRASLPDDVPLFFQPYLFARSEGLRATRQVATSLAAELQ
jgi:anion-transporting  ArsA/GET3 family ATPase